VAARAAGRRSYRGGATQQVAAGHEVTRREASPQPQASPFDKSAVFVPGFENTKRERDRASEITSGRKANECGLSRTKESLPPSFIKKSLFI